MKAAPDRNFFLLAAVCFWSGLAQFTAAAATTNHFSLKAGDLALGLASIESGIWVQSLADAGRGKELLATNAVPLFTVVLREVGTKKEARLSAEAGWGEVAIRKTAAGTELDFGKRSDPGLEGLGLRVTVRADEREPALRWKLSVTMAGTGWSVWRVLFPQVALADLGEGGAICFPRGPGEVQRGVWGRDFRYHGNYPGGWCAMQYAAAYQEGENRTGLYVGLHDPWGSTKEIEVKSEPKLGRVLIGFEMAAPAMGNGGNGFELSGEGVWQLLRGDWYDAAVIYRAWVRKEARWWPELGRDGRADTARWMRELSAWVQTGGGPEQCVPAVKKFQSALGLPVGFHWYNWHQIPFDNDYPHYFPAKPNFGSGVGELQKAGVFVMPYVNGRLWDSKDRGADDFEFKTVALAAATKRENGEPYLESYGSKETNGAPVRLAAMCPSTALWQGRVSGIVLRLLSEVGTRGVYIDQVAAAAPTLCMDASHGHAVGGGHWWNEGYWKMLDGIRGAMPKESMLTTECNGEPFVRWFDGYLTWHWQYDGQVPAFPAVYGGAIQMFGRAYRGGATKNLAFRMKAGQQLVFGEQIGWFGPEQASEPDNFDFVRKAIGTRDKLKRYFYAGEMARPPKIKGPIPKVKADWQWSGEWWVTTDAVLTGAWRLPEDKRAVLLLVNVSDEMVQSELELDRRDYGLPEGPLKCAVIENGGEGKERRWDGKAEPVRIEPRSVQAFEFGFARE